MGTILSVLFLSLGFIWGCSSKKTAGWFLIWTLPLLGPSGFYLFSSSLLPLTIYRIGFFVVIGMTLKYWKNIKVKPWQVKYTKIYVLFFIVLFLLLLSYNPISALTTLFPIYFIGITLPFILIERESDLNKLITVFVWQGAIIGFLAILEFYTPLAPAEIVRFNLPDYVHRDWITRSGVQRVMGLHANSVNTAYHLAFLFPLAMFYAIAKNNIKRLKYLPILLIILGLIFLQTRAAIVSIIISTVLFFMFSVSSKSQWKITGGKLIIRIIIVLLFVSPAVIYFIPSAQVIANEFFSNLLQTFGVAATGQGAMPEDQDITHKLLRIPYALELIKESPIWGYLVSPIEAYYELMNTADLPAILLYILGGGIIFGLLYLYLLFYMINHLRKLALKFGKHNIYLSRIISFSFYAILSGTIVVFSNLVETHFLFMHMLYFSIIIVIIKQYYIVNQKD